MIVSDKETTQSAEADGIPHHLHFIWLGADTPSWVVANVESFKARNPDLRVSLWRDEDLRWLRNQKLFDECRSLAGKSDIARYEVLHRFGGLYVDCDFECIRSLEPIWTLTHDADVVMSSERPGLISNGLMGSTAGAALLDDLILNLPLNVERSRQMTTQVQTGPNYVTSRVQGWLLAGETPPVMVPRDWVYPYNYDKLDRARGPWSEDTIMVHHWNQARTGHRQAGLHGGLRHYYRRARKRVHPKKWAREAVGLARQIDSRRRFKPNAAPVSDEHFVVADRDGWPVMVSRSELDVTGFLYCQGVYDPNFQAFLGRTLSGSDVYVDVGANIGQFVLRAARSLSAYGRVIAVEPNPQAAEVLQSNVYMWRNRGLSCEIQVHGHAIGDMDQRNMKLLIPHNHAGRASALSGSLRDLSPEELSQIEVPCRSLDALLQGLSHIRLIKLDVEGAELEALQGGRETLFSGRVDFVDVEVQSAFLGHRRAELAGIFGELKKHGAEFFTLGRLGRLRAGGLARFESDPNFSTGHFIIDLRKLGTRT